MQVRAIPELPKHRKDCLFLSACFLGIYLRRPYLQQFSCSLDPVTTRGMQTQACTAYRSLSVSLWIPDLPSPLQIDRVSQQALPHTASLPGSAQLLIRQWFYEVDEVLQG